MAAITHPCRPNVLNMMDSYLEDNYHDHRKYALTLEDINHFNLTAAKERSVMKVSSKNRKSLIWISYPIILKNQWPNMGEKHISKHIFLVPWMLKTILTEQVKGWLKSDRAKFLIFIVYCGFQNKLLNLMMMWFKGKNSCGTIEVCIWILPTDTTRNFVLAANEVEYLF